jgi:PPOX class probable F420-dependent enzyme
MTDPGFDADRRAFVAGARTATLVTAAADGVPRPVPICFVLDPVAAVLYTPLDEKPKRTDDPHDLARVHDIEARPDVAILVDRWDEDWTRLAWVRCTGQAALLEPGAAGHPGAVMALRAKYPQYATQRLEDRPVIRVSIDRVSSWGAVGAGPPHQGGRLR